MIASRQASATYRTPPKRAVRSQSQTSAMPMPNVHAKKVIASAYTTRIAAAFSAGCSMKSSKKAPAGSIVRYHPGTPCVASHASAKSARHMGTRLTITMSQPTCATAPGQPSRRPRCGQSSSSSDVRTRRRWLPHARARSRGKSESASRPNAMATHAPASKGAAGHGTQLETNQLALEAASSSLASEAPPTTRPLIWSANADLASAVEVKTSLLASPHGNNCRGLPDEPAAVTQTAALPPFGRRSRRIFWGCDSCQMERRATEDRAKPAQRVLGASPGQCSDTL